MTATSSSPGRLPHPPATHSAHVGCGPLGRGGAPAPAADHDQATGAVPPDPVAEAFRTWLRACTTSGWVPDPAVETVSVPAARGRVTASRVTARWSVPAYRAAAMDGIAVADATVTGPYPRVLDAGSLTWVDTGDPVPGNADRVIVREALAPRPDGGVEITEPPPVARHVRPVGEDVLAGAVVLPAGHRIRPVDVAAVAAAGHVSLSVRRRPRVAIVPTGDEIRPLGSTLRPGEILDTNSLMLHALLDDAGCVAWTLPVVPDVPGDIATALADAALSADLVLVLAGSSAGRDDHTGSAIDRLGRVAVHGVAMRPGHPVLLGVLGGDVPEDGPRRPAAPPVPVVGVPGYPASAEQVMRCFVLPLVDRILGVPAEAEHHVSAQLAAPVSSPEQLDEYRRVRLASVTGPATASEHLVAVPLPRGAGAVSTLTRTEAVLRIPVGTAHLAAGQPVSVTPVTGATFAATTTIVAGRASATTEVLVGLHRAEAAACVLHWSELSEAAALHALAAGLCHAAAVALPLGDAHTGAVAALTGQLGPLTVLEIARAAGRVEALVVPAAGFDSRPVVELRSTLSSMPFRRRLRELPGWSGRTSGRETWHGSDSGEPGDPADGAARCATR